MSTDTNTYLGTKLSGDDYRSFSVRAAEDGLSRSALLRKLAREYIADMKRRADSADSRPGKRKEVA